MPVPQEILHPDVLRLPIQVEPLGEDTMVVTLHGDVDLTEAGELRAVLNDACAEGHRTVIVDLSTVHFIGSSGIGVLAVVHAQLTDADRHLFVIEASMAIRRAFEVAGLGFILEP